MQVKDLLDMTLREVLDEYCILYSPECDYVYGIGKWDDLAATEIEFDLEDEYCFDGDYMMQYFWEIDFDGKVLELEDMIHILDTLGIKRKKEDDNDD